MIAQTAEYRIEVIEEKLLDAIFGDENAPRPTTAKGWRHLDNLAFEWESLRKEIHQEGENS